MRKDTDNGYEIIHAGHLRKYSETNCKMDSSAFLTEATSVPIQDNIGINGKVNGKTAKDPDNAIVVGKTMVMNDVDRATLEYHRKLSLRTMHPRGDNPKPPEDSLRKPHSGY